MRHTRVIPLVLLVLVSSCAAQSYNRAPNIPEPPPYVGPPEITAPMDAISIAPDADARAIVAEYDPGATFVFEPGVHRLQRPINPRNGDTFIGKPGAILSGAVPVQAEGQENGLWYVGDLRLDESRHGVCRSDSPECSFRHDLFLDGKMLTQVSSLVDVVTGTWAFDDSSNRAYFFDDPSGRLVELSMARSAFEGAANGVTIAYLTIEKFANQAQHGAIMAERTGSNSQLGANWTIVGNVVRHNHGVGIRSGSGAWIVENFVHDNGQLGIASYSGNATRIEGNEIARNNVSGYAEEWEAGGTKFIRTDNLIVRHNFVHENFGPGIWTDIDNYNTLIEHNVVEHNSGTGIFHEISYDAVIRFNDVRSNGTGLGETAYAYAYGAGILVANSGPVHVYGNHVMDNWNGIVGLEQRRGQGARGQWTIRGLYVYDNEVSLAFHEEGISSTGTKGLPAITGVVQDLGLADVFGESYGIRFEHNRYLVEDTGGRHFAWADRTLAFIQWQRCSNPSRAWLGWQHDVEGQLSVTGSE